MFLQFESLARDFGRTPPNCLSECPVFWSGLDGTDQGLLPLSNVLGSSRVAFGAVAPEQNICQSAWEIVMRVSTMVRKLVLTSIIAQPKPSKRYAGLTALATTSHTNLVCILRTYAEGVEQ